MTDCYVYVDGANLFRSGEEEGIRIDYQKFKVFLMKRGNLRALNYYEAYCNDSKDKFFEILQSFGYNLKTVLVHKYGNEPPKEKIIDTQIVADSLWDAFNNKFDIAIFCSGDSDILPAVEYILQMKKRLRLSDF